MGNIEIGGKMNDTPRPPKHLGKAGKAFWKTTLVDFDLEAYAQAILTRACECLDRIDQAQEIIAAEGVHTTDRYGQARTHPAVTLERDSRTACLACVKALNLDLEPLG